MKRVLRYVYAKSFPTVIVTILICIILWALISQKAMESQRYNKIFKWINTIFFCGTVTIILYITIVSRASDKSEVCLIPFYSFVMAMKQPEMYRSMLMNVLLFEPIGLTLPFALPDKLHKKPIITIGFGFLLSVSIELMQYLFYLGRAEVDDVLCNTLGCAIGTVAYLIYKNREIINKCLGELALAMKEKLKKIISNLSKTKFVIILSLLWQLLTWIEYIFFQVKWMLTGKKKPASDGAKLVCEECTFIFKSFERQKMAKRLYKNVQKYYPGIRVIIADDSGKPLELQGENLEVIQLPFNSGLSVGLNRALEKVTTPYVIRMDDDELLTPFTRFEKQLEFLKKHSEVDLVSVLLYHLPNCKSMETLAQEYYKQPMNYAPKPLKIPHMTKIDDTYCVLGKTPNTFIIRTDKYKEIGYDDNIRMIDHNEFFFRAAGNLVSVLDTTAFVVHYHNRFDVNYQKYRDDYLGDKIYIAEKMKKCKIVVE